MAFSRISAHTWRDNGLKHSMTSFRAEWASIANPDWKHVQIHCTCRITLKSKSWWQCFWGFMCLRRSLCSNSFISLGSRWLISAPNRQRNNKNDSWLRTVFGSTLHHMYNGIANATWIVSEHIFLQLPGSNHPWKAHLLSSEWPRKHERQKAKKLAARLVFQTMAATFFLSAWRLHWDCSKICHHLFFYSLSLP